MKKRYKALIGAAVIVLVYLLIFPVPVKIDKTVHAVEVAIDDDSFCEPVNVTINGTYRWRLLGKDSFRGDISFDAYALTVENALVQTENIAALTQQDGGDDLDYGEWMDSQLFGYMSWKPFFSKLVVLVYVPDGNGGGEWNDSDGHCIVGGAESREGALKVLKRFSNIHLPPYENWTD
jgi:hypothetical protein